MDTALKTADTGAMQHRLVKALENSLIGYDGSVRNVSGTLFSPIYNSGYDVAEMVAIADKSRPDLSSFMDIKMSVEEMNIKRGWIPKAILDLIAKAKAKLALEPPHVETILTTGKYVRPILLVVEVDITQPVQRRDPPIKITKYEKARLIGARATQLSYNAPPLIDIGEELDAVKIATREYEAGLNPLYVIRRFADNSHMIVRPTLEHI